METGPDPMVQRRRLRVELRKARTEARLTQREVAERLDWSPSKLLRIENGQVGVSSTDLRALLQIYGLDTSPQAEEFVRLARLSRRQTWASFSDVLGNEFVKYLGFEGSASSIRQHEQLYVPGLLQTEDYARAIIETFAEPNTPSTVVERQVEVRLQRQAILRSAGGPTAHFLLDEAVLRRRAGAEHGDPSLMSRQLIELKEVARLPSVVVQVVPFAYGLHKGMRGPFVILEFPDPQDDDLLYLEGPPQSIATRDDPDELAEYKDLFWRLESLATPVDQLAGFIDQVVADLG